MKKYLLPIMLVLGTLRIFSLDIEILDEDLDLPLEGARVAYSGGEVFADPDGKVSVELPGGARRLVFSLPGYDDKTVVVQEDRKELTVRLRMSGIIEGQELVVEKAVPLVSDSQAGVAVAVSERQMESTAQIGVVEDVMSTIKTLPGVGYAGGWNARPSIRGGSPSETTVVLDGFEVIYPYHWGGAFSIFNPNMVDSAKLSAGLVSARYGRNISGLLEINSKTPDKPSFGFEASLTTTGTEAFVQAPLGKDAGLLLGGKLTWMEVSFALAGADGTFNQVPFIRDGYGKFFWKPADRLSFYANAFFGSDGVGVKIDSEPDEDSTIQTKGAFDWINLTGILSGGLKWLPTDTLLVQAMGGWNRFHERPEFQSTSSGEVEYSQAFLDKYDGDGTFDLDGADNGTINGAASFAVDGTYFEFLEDEVTDIFQGRAEAEWMSPAGTGLVIGGDGFYQRSGYGQEVDGYSDFFQGGVDLYTPISLVIDTDDNMVLNSGLFALVEFGSSEDAFSGEVGVRADHTYLWNDDISIQTWPVANPRLRFAWRPVRDAGKVRSLSFTAGGGLFSKLPFFARLFEERYGFEDFDFAPDRAAFGLAGTEIQLEGGWKFSLEGYYKYYFRRTYLTETPETNPIEMEIHDDGIGFATGFDLMLQKAESRWLDGYLTYSFVYARYKNPLEPVKEGQSSLIDGAPLGEWYYPSYHRFHNLNLIMNFKPASRLTLTVKGSLASGAPKAELGAAEPYAAVMRDADGTETVIERWRRSSTYSDTLRNDLSCPVDLKATFSDYYPRSKIRWEYYVGLENVFANLYTPKTNKSMDAFTGKDLSGSDEADFTIGSPVPSFGFKLSY